MTFLSLTKRLPLICVMLWLTVGMSISASANIRAPHIRQYPASTSFTPLEGLVVEGEHLVFQLGKPYTGDIWTVDRELREAEIEATYRIRSQTPLDAAFEFVMALPSNRVEVAINGRSIDTTQIAPIELDTLPQRRHPENAYVRFNGHLHEGGNEIRVRYRQLLGRDELDHGYFKTSKWASMVAYELWPLKEWQLAPDFRLQIEVRAEDDTSALRSLFLGSRYELEVLGQTRTDQDHFRDLSATPLSGGTVQKASGSLILRHELDANFPPRIVAVVREKGAHIYGRKEK